MTKRLGVIWILLTIVRNTLYFARTRLNTAIEAEAALLAHYEQEATKHADEQQAAYTQLVEEAVLFEDTGSARDEWIAFWEHANQNVQSFIDFRDIPDDNVPQSALQTTQLDQLLFQYLNKKYLGMS